MRSCKVTKREISEVKFRKQEALFNVTRGHLRSKVHNKGHVLIFIETDQRIVQNKALGLNEKIGFVQGNSRSYWIKNPENESGFDF